MNPTTWRRLTIGTALFALLGVGACEVTPGEKYGVSSRQFHDIVVPDGFRLRDAGHESYSREEAGWREGHFVYVGAASPADAMGYVRQRMPQHNWTVVEEQQLENGAKMRFQRGFYSADYSFVRTEGSTRMVVDYTTDYSRR